MSQRRELEQHLHALHETREIMNSMKSLALIESRKLSRFHTAQLEVVREIEAMADEFRRHHPITPQLPEGASEIVLLLGSERGFCGDFNSALLRRHEESAYDNPPQLIAVGRKLSILLEEAGYDALLLEGASVAEEVDKTLLQLIEALQSQPAPFHLSMLHHAGEDSEVQSTTLLPPFQQPPTPAPYSHPPLLNLKPRYFFAQLMDDYLFAALHHLFFASLLAENQRRMQHLEGAIQRLDDQANELVQKRNILRQEEITEEIEVILLSVGETGVGTR